MQWWCSAQGAAWDWTWKPYPGVWLFIILIAIGYVRLVRRSTAAGMIEGRAWRSTVFGFGLAGLWAALDWPIGALGAGYLASAHMLQFLLITLIAPPLLLAGLPPTFYQGLGQRPVLVRVLRFLTHPLIVLVIFNTTMITTHLPAVSDRLMVTQVGSFVIDIAWLTAGLTFWWPIIAPVPERPWMHALLKIGLLTAQTIAGIPLFFYLTFSEFPVYAVYELAPRVHGIGAHTDQQTAGLIMNIVGGMIFMVALTVIFLQWSKREEKKAINAGLDAVEGS